MSKRLVAVLPSGVWMILDAIAGDDPVPTSLSVDDNLFTLSKVSGRYALYVPPTSPHSPSGVLGETFHPLQV